MLFQRGSSDQQLTVEQTINDNSRLTHLLKLNLKKGTLVKLTIDVVLQHAIAFCQEGKLRDAELLYQGILQPQRR